MRRGRRGAGVCAWAARACALALPRETIYGATHSLAVGLRKENLLAMKEGRERYGRYPIRVAD